MCGWFPICFARCICNWWNHKLHQYKNILTCSICKEFFLRTKCWSVYIWCVFVHWQNWFFVYIFICNKNSLTSRENLLTFCVVRYLDNIYWYSCDTSNICTIFSGLPHHCICDIAGVVTYVGRYEREAMYSKYYNCTSPVLFACAVSFDQSSISRRGLNTIHSCHALNQFVLFHNNNGNGITDYLL